MRTNAQDNSIWQILLVFFFLSGFLHVVLYGVPYATGIIQIFNGAVLLLWITTILRRIVDRRVRQYLIGIAALMLLYYVIQLNKYSILADVISQRYAWYCFYIPMILIPLCFFFLAVYMNHSEEDNYGRKWLWLYVPAFVLLALVLTNDLHTMVFHFPNGLTEADGYTGTYIYRPVYYIVIVWEILLFLLALIIILRKCRIFSAKKYLWLPVRTLLAGGVLMILSILGIAPKVHGVTVWQLTEMYNYTMVLFLEACIGIGLIPSNTGYEKLFHLLRMPMIIHDSTEHRSITSASPMREDNLNIKTMEIYGGRVSWGVDLKEINSLNQQIIDITSQIASRNERLLSEKQMREEKAALNERNRLYDQIAEAVKPQLNQIEALLQEQITEDYDSAVAKINVLNAYIKRRSNMELLKVDRELLSVMELDMAIRESVEYLKDTGVIGTVSSCSSQRELPAELVILAYELFENVLETTLDTAKMVAVFLQDKNEAFVIRLMIETKDNQDRLLIDLIPEEVHRNIQTSCKVNMQEEQQEAEHIITIQIWNNGGGI